MQVGRPGALPTTRTAPAKTTTLIDVRLARKAAQKRRFPNRRFVPTTDIIVGMANRQSYLRAGPICGARTGFAIPKKMVTPWPPQRVEMTSDGTPKQLSMSCQLFMTQTSPAGPMAKGSRLKTPCTRLADRVGVRLLHRMRPELARVGRAGTARLCQLSGVNRLKYGARTSQAESAGGLRVGRKF